MRVKINRNVCSAHLAFCERCLGQFLKHPLGYERRCFVELEDDHSDTLMIELQSSDNVRVLRLDAEQRRMLAGTGWSAFVDFDVPMYRDTNTKHDLNKD